MHGIRTSDILHMLLGEKTGIGPLVVTGAHVPRTGHSLVSHKVWLANGSALPPQTDVVVLRPPVAKGIPTRLYKELIPRAVATLKRSADAHAMPPCPTPQLHCLLTPAILDRLHEGARCGVARVLARTRQGFSGLHGLWTQAHRPVRVAMHVRRGDIVQADNTPLALYQDRFTADAWYFAVVDMLQRCLPGMLDVLVFTEPPENATSIARAREFYAEYARRNVTVHFPDTADAALAMAHLVSAHIMVQARSGFSGAATVFSNNCVVAAARRATHEGAVAAAGAATTAAHPGRLLNVPDDVRPDGSLPATMAALDNTAAAGAWLRSCLPAHLHLFVRCGGPSPVPSH